MSATPGRYAHFRLNLEQQRKRARELLNAARDGDAAALARFRNHPPKLAEAQYLIARDLRFDDWPAMKTHIAALSRERASMEAAGAAQAEGSRQGVPLDGTSPDGVAPAAGASTLHLRCGSDLRQPLLDAGFRGDFHEHSYPYLIGPVHEGPGSLEERARFIVQSYAGDFEPVPTFDAVLRAARLDEQRLHDSATLYERVVIWSEADVYDQLVLVRLLGHYAAHRSPPRLELINVATFPGATRFIGLGQLPPEALRLLWPLRRPATLAQLSLGLAAWKALASADPRALAGICRTGTPELPLLAPALHRHLRELPDRDTGLGFTQQMALQLLARQPATLNQLFHRIGQAIDPLPGQGDLQFRDRVLPLAEVTEPLFTRYPATAGNRDANPPWTDVLTITAQGRAVLRGEADFHALHPPPRWVGGVPIGRDFPDWRWDEIRRDAILR